MLYGLESRVLLKAREELEKSAFRIEKQKPLYCLVRPPTGNSSRLPEVPLPPSSRVCRRRYRASFFLGTTLLTSTTSIVKWLSFRSQRFRHRFSATIQWPSIQWLRYSSIVFLRKFIFLIWKISHQDIFSSMGEISIKRYICTFRLINFLQYSQTRAKRARKFCI